MNFLSVLVQEAEHEVTDIASQINYKNKMHNEYYYIKKYIYIVILSQRIVALMHTIFIT